MARHDDAINFEHAHLFDHRLGRREIVLMGLMLAILALAGPLTQDAFLSCFGIYTFASLFATWGITWILRHTDRSLMGIPPWPLLAMKVCAYLSAVALPIGAVAHTVSSWVLSNADGMPDYAETLNASGALVAVLLPLLSVLEYVWRRRAAQAHPAAVTHDEVAQQQLAALEQLAYQDALTGLPNRRRFEDALTQLGADGQDFAVMFVDFDKFKPINDLHGHAVGDEFLKAIAHRIKSLVRDGDLVARLGGDEFAVLIRGAEAKRASEHLAERFTQAMQEPVACTGVALQSSASVGLAVGRAGHDDREQVVRQADLAMYEAKRAGGARVCMAG
jgi:diguanylate cyclase (GGDEF)-like protein